MLSPDVVLPAVLALLLAGFLVVRPKALILLTAVTIIFVRSAVHLSGSTLIASLDDVLVALCFARAIAECVVRRRAPRRLPGDVLFAAFLLLGVVSALVHGAGPTLVTVQGTYLAGKFLLFGWAVAQFDWRSDDLRRIVRATAALAVLVLACCGLNLLFPGTWNAVFAGGGEANERFGVPSLIGPFEHPFDLAFFCSMVFVALLAYRQRVRRTPFTMALLLGTGGATVLSFRRKDLLGLLTAFVAQLLRFRRSGTVLAVLLVAPIAVALVWQEVSSQVELLTRTYLTVDSGEARTLLLLGSVQIAGDYLPLGAGFGRFASRTAAAQYSPEYLRLGLDDRYGLGPGAGQGAFLTDTSWPAILGEAGVLGAVAFVGALLMVLLAFRRWERSGVSADLRLVGTIGVGWVVLTVFQSTGAAVFSSPPVYGSLLGLTGLAVALQRTALDDDGATPVARAERARA